MRNYNVQYKKYYQDLQRKSTARYNFNNYGNPIGENNLDYKVKPKKSVFIDLINILTYQIMIVILMFIFIFYCKYSESTENIKVFSSIKSYITGELRVEEVFESIKVDNINKIFSDIDREIKVLEQ